MESRDVEKNREPRPDKRFGILVLSLLFLAVLVRLPVLNWGLPGPDHNYSYHPDEIETFTYLRAMNPGELDFNPKEFTWPTLYVYSSAASLAVGHLVGALTLTTDPDHYRDHPEDLRRLYLIPRLLTLSLSMAGLLILALLTRELYGRTAAGWALLFAAVSQLWVVKSCHMTPHSPAVTMQLAAMLAGVFVMRSDGRRPLLAAGLLYGLAVTTLYDAFILICPLTIAYVTAVRAGRRRWMEGVVPACLLAALGFIVGTPYAILSPGDFLASLQGVSDYLGLLSPDYIKPAVLLTWGMSLPLAGLSAAGLLLALYRRRNADLYVLAWLIPYYFLIGRSGADFLRRVLPLFPGLFILDGALLAQASGLLTGRASGSAYAPPASHKLTASLVGLIVAGYAFLYTCAYLTTTTVGETREQATAWINATFPPGSRIGLFNWFLDPHLDIERYDCRLYGTKIETAPGQELDAFVATELELPIQEAEALFDHPVSARFVYRPSFGPVSINDENAPEDWLYTHPPTYVIDLR